MGRANSTIGSASSMAAKGPGSVLGGGQKALGGATKAIAPFQGSAGASYPGDKKKKVAVKPGQPKPFTPPIEHKKPDPKKPYPGKHPAGTE